MSTCYRPEEKIRVEDLFDGRLKPHGVVEHQHPESDAKRRALFDGQNYLWVGADDDGYVSAVTRYGMNAPKRILSAIAEAFETEIYSEYEPQFWGFDTQEEWDAVMAEQARKDRDEFYADILRYLRGQRHMIRPGTNGMLMAEIAQRLTYAAEWEWPHWECPDNQDEFMAAIEAEFERKHTVVVHLDEKDMAAAKMAVTDSDDLPKA